MIDNSASMVSTKKNITEILNYHITYSCLAFLLSLLLKDVEEYIVNKMYWYLYQRFYLIFEEHKEYNIGPVTLPMSDIYIKWISEDFICLYDFVCCTVGDIGSVLSCCLFFFQVPSFCTDALQPFGLFELSVWFITPIPLF